MTKPKVTKTLKELAEALGIDLKRIDAKIEVMDIIDSMANNYTGVNNLTDAEYQAYNDGAWDMFRALENACKKKK